MGSKHLRFSVRSSRLCCSRIANVLSDETYIDDPHARGSFLWPSTINFQFPTACCLDRWSKEWASSQDTHSGFTTRCCLSSWDLNYPGGFAVSGDDECRTN